MAFPLATGLLGEQKLSAFLSSLEGQGSGPANKPKELLKLNTKTPLGGALRELAASNVLSAPVVEGDSGEYAGIVDVADILACLLRSEWAAGGASAGCCVQRRAFFLCPVPSLPCHFIAQLLIILNRILTILIHRRPPAPQTRTPSC